MNDGLHCTAWFQVDGYDEMIVLAEPVFKFLDAYHHFSYSGPQRGRMRDGAFEIELIFCSKEDAEMAEGVWLMRRRLLGMQKPQM